MKLKNKNKKEKMEENVMSQFRVTASELKSKADELTNLNTSFKSAVESLVNSETNLKTMWEGEANDAFHNAFNGDKSKMDEFAALIERYVLTLQTIATKYETTERQNTSIASQRS